MEDIKISIADSRIIAKSFLRRKQVVFQIVCVRQPDSYDLMSSLILAGESESVWRSLDEFRNLHSRLSTHFKIPSFPEFKSDCHSEAFRESLGAYLEALQRIESIAASFAFQAFLPRICHTHEKLRTRGVLITGIEVVSRFQSYPVHLLVDVDSTWIDITYSVFWQGQSKVLRNTLDYIDIVECKSSSRDSNLVILKTCSSSSSSRRTFRFENLSDAQLFVELVNIVLIKTKSRKTLISSRVRAWTRTIHSDLFTSLDCFCVSWNMGRVDLGSFARDLLPLKKSHDLYAIGVQECISFSKSLSGCEEQDVLSHLGHELGDEFSLLTWKSLWEIGLFIFIKAELVAMVSTVEVQVLATGLLGAGNKGAIGASLRIYQTQFCFVTCHLAAHEGEKLARNRMFSDIVSHLSLGNPQVSLSLEADYVIWLGDLNYRIELPNHVVAGLASRGHFKPLLQRDELKQELSLERAFCGFREAPIHFGPTFKFVLGEELEFKSTSESMDFEAEIERVLSKEEVIELCAGIGSETRGYRPYNLKRTPAYTDRILWKCNALEEEEAFGVCVNSYESNPGVTLSDHIPVMADLTFSCLKQLSLGAFSGECSSINVVSLTLSLSSSSLASASAVSLVFLGNVLMEQYSSPLILLSELFDSSLEAHWPKRSLPSLELRIRNLKLLRIHRVLFNVLDQNSTSLAQGNFLLGSATLSDVWSTDCELYSRGITCG